MKISKNFFLSNIMFWDKNKNLFFKSHAERQEIEN